MPVFTKPSGSRAGNKRLRLGFLALTDAAPLVAAHELGLFRERSLDVELCREVGWATVRDKIFFGELHAAQTPAPLLWAMQLGLGGPQRDVLTALVLNRHGNAIVLSTRLLANGVRDDGAFRLEARRRRGENRLTLGIVHPFSVHHLLLRQWLATIGLDPENDVRIVVVPPAQMFRNLAAGTLDGYCAGEPWGTVAVQSGHGWCPAISAQLSPGHVEKVLTVSTSFSRERHEEHFALVAALAAAGAWCDETGNHEQLIAWLAGKRYLDVNSDAIRMALSGRFDRGLGQTENITDFHIFSRGEANVPSPSDAAQLQSELVAAGLVSKELATPELPARLFRTDLYRTAIATAATQPVPLRPTNICLV
jgi:two-component system, oxyanion-binding sensor